MPNVQPEAPRSRIEPRAHHPRAEAAAQLEGRYTVRVLEPSPPAITAPPHAADDPTARASDNERRVVSPVATGDLSWSDIVEARDDARFTIWCQERWLAAWRPLRAPGEGWQRAVAEHRALAHEVLGPWRAVRSGGTGHRTLRATFGGYGTPFCWDDQQLRMEGDQLVLQRAGEVAGLVPDDLDEAAAFAGVPSPGNTDRLELDPDLAADIADWIAFATLVFERVRARLGIRARVQLDPGPFAVGLELPGGRARLSLQRPGIELHGEVVVPGAVLVGRDDHVFLAERTLLSRL